VRRGFYQDVLRSQFDNAPERDADLGYMAEFAARYRSLERFLAQLALVGSTVIHDAETEEREDEDLLTLTTIHQAKGLEWDVVFLIGLADGKLPHARNLEPPERLEEERRLFYVAITRCKRYLELTVPLMVNNMSGGNEVCRPSRFVEELPSDAVELIKAADAENLRLAAGGRVRLTVDW
jgi:DNA helicase-2/ATP-dependent DNA helicase PcrA